MSELDDVLAAPVGAQFRRADLHIHSYGGSHDVQDVSLSPTNIVTTAKKEGLDIVAVTDHNEIKNVRQALESAASQSILVIPGVELSTPQGHLLCYLPTLDALERFYSRLDIVDRGGPDSRCQQGVLECLNVVGEMGGFGVLAHVDGGAGIEQVLPGGSKHKTDIICHRVLLGIELKNAQSVVAYSPADSDTTRAQMGRERVRRLGLGSQQWLARVLNSDAHTLAALGRNAQQERRVTRYKMDVPTFGALRIALEDGDARTRIEDLIPASVPSIVGAKFGGGFLRNQIFHFSSNLNCIIGGRGTGKSTAFEGVRSLSDQASESKVVDLEAWPDELHLFWKDEAGQIHSLYRAKEGEVENRDDPVFGPT